MREPCRNPSVSTTRIVARYLEAEQEYYNDEDIAFRIAVFYFAPGGYNNKEQRIEVTAVADCEGRYLPSDKLLSTFDETMATSGEVSWTP